jgi:hypothetical protein
VDWFILEHRDGVVVDLLYAGPPDAGITVDGVVEGQGNVALHDENEPGTVYNYNAWASRRRSRSLRFLSALLASVVAVLSVVGLVLNLRRYRLAKNALGSPYYAAAGSQMIRKTPAEQVADLFEYRVHRASVLVSVAMLVGCVVLVIGAFVFGRLPLLPPFPL